MTDIANKINKFRYTLVNNFNNLDLGNFYSNLDSLKIIKSTDEIYGKLNYYTNSYYNCEKNIINIKKNKIDDMVLYHELFHMASNITINNNVRDGFYINQGDINIGFGINEGYTEYLTRKYFGDNHTCAYEFEVTIAKNIEDVIDNNKMISFYLRGELESLINELSKYAYINDVMRFINNVDYVYHHLYDEERESKIINIVSKINIFLVKIKIKKYLDIYDLDYLKENKDELLKIKYNNQYFSKFNAIQDENFFNYIFSKFKSKSK